MNKKELITLSNELYSDAQDASAKKNYGKAAELFYCAAECQYKAGDKLHAAKFHSLAYLNKIQDERYLKDRINLEYLGPMESILKEENQLEMLIEQYKRINEQLLKTRHFQEARDFYIKEMNTRKELFKNNKKYVMFSLYWLWDKTSQFGESAWRLFMSILLLSIIQAIMIYPAPIDIMSTIRIMSKDFPFTSLMDYWYFSFATLFSWDWKSIKPLNILGFLFILIRFLLSSLIIASLIKLLIRKLSPR